MTIWYILYSFGTFFRFWYHVPRKIWQPWLKRYLFFLPSEAVALAKRFCGQNETKKKMAALEPG
jgi:hypothetical protein